MKNLSFAIILLVVPLFFISCSKDDTDELAEAKGEFLLNGEKYDLHKGGIWYFMEHPENVHIFFIELFSSGLSGNVDEGYTDYGDLVSFILTSQNWDLPEPGSYPIVNEEEAGNPGDALFAAVYRGIHVEGTEEVAEHYYVLTSGNIVFNKEGNEYEFIVDATGNKLDFDTEDILVENIEITLNYKGNLSEQLLDEEP